MFQILDLETLKEKLQPYLEKEEWIIDGDYHKTLEMRLPYATDVFVLDLSRKECIQGILDRIDQPRDDIPWIEREDDATSLIAWTADYGFRTKDEEISLMYPIKEIISVKNYALDKTYLKDIDYVITKKGNFKLTENTSIPNLNPNNFYLDEVDGPVKVMVNNDKSDKNRNGKYFLYGEEDTFTK